MAVRFNDLRHKVRDVISTGLPLGLIAHELLIGNSTGGIGQVASVGTAGQLLTSNGAGADPSWQAAAGGGPADRDVWLSGLMLPTGLGYTVQAETFPRILASLTSTLTAATARWTAIGLPKGVTISQMTMGLTSSAEAGGTHGWYAITDNAGKVLAVTADQTGATVWSPANSLITIPFAAPFTTTYRGIHFVWVSVTASTEPSFAAIGGITSVAEAAPSIGGNGPFMSAPPAVGSTLAFSTPTVTAYYATVG